VVLRVIVERDERIVDHVLRFRRVPEDAQRNGVEVRRAAVVQLPHCLDVATRHALNELAIHRRVCLRRHAPSLLLHFRLLPRPTAEGVPDGTRATREFYVQAAPAGEVTPCCTRCCTHVAPQLPPSPCLQGCDGSVLALRTRNDAPQTR